MNTPAHKFEHLNNFRDFGGYPTRDGRRIKHGMLYRSAQHSVMSDQDLETLHALNLEAIIDLRLPSERLKQPSRRHPAFAGRIIDSDLGERESSPWLTFIQQAGGFTGPMMREWMLDWYRAAAFEAQHLELFRLYFAALSETQDAVLIHCAAGKDRTGILAALTQHLLGVAEQYRLRDYLLTNDTGLIERFTPQLVRMITDASGQQPDRDALRSAMWIEPEYLQTAFTAITERHGSVDAYLEQALGVDARQRALICERLLEADSS